MSAIVEYSIALDGGGSKLLALLFRPDFTFVRSARAGSINRNFTSAEEALANISLCIDELLEGLSDVRISCVYSAFTGNIAEVLARLQERCPVERSENLGEARVGLLAAGIAGDGILSLAGTGSDVYLVRNGTEADVVGGWGALISDEGSGYYIGRMALRAVAAAHEGYGDPTMLTELLCEETGRPRPNNAVLSVYAHAAPTARIASLSRLVSIAAQKRDPIAIGILDHNARAMAKQTLALTWRNRDSEHLPLGVAGGAWKTWSYIRRYQEQLQLVLPGIQVRKPLFEPAVGAVAASMAEKKLLDDTDFAFLKREYAPFVPNEYEKGKEDHDAAGSLF